MELEYIGGVDKPLDEDLEMNGTGYKTPEHTEVELLTGKCMHIMHGLIKDYKELASQIKLHDERILKPGKTKNFHENGLNFDKNSLSKENYKEYGEDKTFKEIDSWIREVNQNIMTVQQYESDKDLNSVRAFDLDIQNLASPKLVDSDLTKLHNPTFANNVEIHYCFKEKNSGNDTSDMVKKPCHIKDNHNDLKHPLINKYREIDKSNQNVPKNAKDDNTFQSKKELNCFNTLSNKMETNVGYKNVSTLLIGREKFDSTQLSDEERSISISIDDDQSNRRDSKSDLEYETDGLSDCDVWTTYMVNGPDEEDKIEETFQESNECTSEIEIESQSESDIILLTPKIKDSYIEDAEVIVISKEKKDNIDILHQSVSLLKEKNIIVISKNDLKDVIQVLGENSCEKIQILTREMIESDGVLLNHLYASLADTDDEEEEEEEKEDEYEEDLGIYNTEKQDVLLIENEHNMHCNNEEQIFNGIEGNTNDIEEKSLDVADSFEDTIHSKKYSIDNQYYKSVYPEPEYVSDVLMKYQYKEYVLKENKNRLYKLLIEDDAPIRNCGNEDEKCLNEFDDDDISYLKKETYLTSSSEVENNRGILDKGNHPLDIYNINKAASEKTYSEISFDVVVEKHTKQTPSHHGLERQL